MKTFIIDFEQAKALKNLQVSFTLDQFSTIEIVQIEFYDEFTGFYQNADLSKYPKSAKDQIEEICMNWYNNIYSQTA